MRMLLQPTLPDPDNRPSHGPQFPANLSVPALVPLYLFDPEFPSGFWYNPAVWTPVPEAPVHENSDFLFRENEVRFPGKGLVPPPSGDVVVLEQFYQGKLGALVSLSPDFGHDVRALFAVPDISHSTTFALDPSRASQNPCIISSGS